MKQIAQAKEILKIAIPSGLGSFLDVLNISIALFFIGQLSTSHIVAYGAGMNFVMLFYALFAIFFTGTNATIARFFGQKDPRLQEAMSSLILNACVFSIPLFLLGFFAFPHFLSWLGLQAQSLHLATLYLEIIVFEIPFLLLKSTLNSIFSATSNTKYPFWIKSFCTLIHFGLNYALIFGWWIFPALDMKGMALSNLICSSLEVMLLFLWLFKLFGWKKSFHLSIIKNALKIGFPTGIERALTLFSLTLIAKFLLFYGDEVLAGFQIGGRIESFVFMPGFGFMIASMSLVGQNAANQELSKSYTTLCLWISSILMGSLGILMCLISQEVAMIFSQNADVVTYAKHYLIAVGISQVPLIFIFVLDGAFKGAGKSDISLYTNGLSIWILRILPMYLCSIFNLPYYFIFGIICLETYIRAMIFWVIFYKKKWKAIKY